MHFTKTPNTYNTTTTLKIPDYLDVPIGKRREKQQQHNTQTQQKRAVDQDIARNNQEKWVV